MTEHHDPLALEADLPSSLMTVNLGPSHPAMHGTLRLTVTLDGENIVEAIPEIGFLHRGFIMGVEKLLGIKDTERSQYLRVLAGEISRITDHLTCIGAIGLELGAFTV